jgi:thioredoxin family protein
MITTVLFALGVSVCAAEPSHESPVTSHVVIDSTYKSLYESGITFAEFLANANARKEQWEKNYAMMVAPDALVTRATAAGSGWKLLVVTIPSCGDSVNSIPYLASLLDKVPSVEMRLINPTAGKAVQEAHRTPDGRAATPTVILLDAEFNERGCWVERPANLLARMKEADFEGRQEWYDKDRGASALEEIVQVIEAAHAGSIKCSSKTP